MIRLAEELRRYATVCRAGKFQWVSAADSAEIKPVYRKCGAMRSEDERALRVARPKVGVWLDKLRRAGHVVFVHQFQQGAKRNGYRISVDGQKMTVWGLWARFRSELGDGEPPHITQLGAANRARHRRR
jgi:hypothetical protein